MKSVIVALLLIPLSLFGKAPEPTKPQTTKDFIVTNTEGTEGHLSADNWRILSEEEDPIAEETLTPPPPPHKVTIDLRQVFKGSPYIYTVLLFLSMTTIFMWLYTILRWRVLAGYSDDLKKRLSELLINDKVSEAVLLCKNKRDILSRMVLASLSSSRTSRKEIEEIMGHVVKQASSATWQRIGILNDIAIISPMLGLMGTVVGMFYAFYDINRSMDSLTKLFDGLGISVATTIAGLCVALLSLLLHTYLKHRLIRRLHVIEQEAEYMLPLLIKKEKL